jgi:predicted  nucleic acid-binding Zn-ribbon protein
LVGQTGQAYKSINADTQKFADAAANQKIVDVITAYQNGLSELDIKQAITGQDQLNARINAATDALVKLKTLGVQDTNEEFIKLQNTLNGLKAEVGLAEIRKRTEEIRKVWDRFNLQISKLDFNKTKSPLEALKSRIDLIGNAIQDLKSKGLTDKDLGIQLLNVQFEQLGAQFEKLKIQKELFDELQKTIEGGLTNAFGSVFEAILNGEDAFESLSKSIKQLVAELAKAIIKSLILKAITSAIAPGSGALGGGIGSTMIRGDMLRNITLGR